MKKHTELEVRLFNFIIYLVQYMNVYNTTLDYIYKSMSSIFNWSGAELKTLNFSEYQKMLEELNEEFEWNFEVSEVKYDANQK